MRKKNTKTAAETYAERQNDIGCLLDLIQQQMAVHAERQAEESSSWGWVGDLGEVASQLTNVLSFLMGGEDEEANRKTIEDHLAEMRQGK